jgi:hypothetical protein
MRAFRRRLVFEEPSPPDEQVMREVHERYRGEVAALSELLGRDMLSFWGYDA